MPSHILCTGAVKPKIVPRLRKAKRGIGSAANGIGVHVILTVILPETDLANLKRAASANGQVTAAGALAGKVHNRSSSINPAVALALPTTPGMPAPGCVPAPTK
jgi:hypothetical protein